VLLEIENGLTKVAVQAPLAQMILDYLNANWPVGTRVLWIVVPPFQPPTPAARNRFFVKATV
jgi:hypothetical protein